MLSLLHSILKLKGYLKEVDIVLAAAETTNGTARNQLVSEVASASVLAC